MAKRISILAGHYGSGKTNIAVNLALNIRNAGKNVTVADLDIVNPYFRTKDSEEDFEKAGIRLISSEYANTNLDAPALPQAQGPPQVSSDGSEPDPTDPRSFSSKKPHNISPSSMCPACLRVR